MILRILIFTLLDSRWHSKFALNILVRDRKSFFFQPVFNESFQFPFTPCPPPLPLRYLVDKIFHWVGTISMYLCMM